MKKFTKEIVVEVFKITGSALHFKQVYGMDIRTVKNIKARRTYADLTKNLGEPGEIVTYGFTPSDIFDIRDSSLSNKELAKKYNVHPETIHNIRTGKTRFFVNEF